MTPGRGLDSGAPGCPLVAAVGKADHSGWAEGTNLVWMGGDGGESGWPPRWE